MADLGDQMIEKTHPRSEVTFSYTLNYSIIFSLYSHYISYDCIIDSG